ncbi:Conjugal transfer protein TrbC [Solidesulfovibrio carbinoliphilus subsp. oakridgensis]|uniref:Conjugal transfer protein TrbC n=1 Tax=Solidesulfovibrio carbinoliphilus subsp. oakridgensis TaxID=694327 RepID=G7QB61_9BACT|nr:TrbC/VirB2 family protein [Solidesulfovibrio carbinoliphilus]EHJ48803.1 Conjugal transfer protein TrbC [Solidesulfovibrio carbinoliphilus subsp. oakridgensis]
MRKNNVFALAAVFGGLFLCSDAFASGGISDFSAPLEKVMNTITGDAGKYISILFMGASGIYYIMHKEDISGGFKLLLSIVFGISFIAFASNIVTTIFTFSGATI